MSDGADQPLPPGEMLASEAERERCQAVLKQAFEDQRLTQDEFESRVGSAISARTLDQLAALTRDLPAPPAPVAAPARSRGVRFRWVVGGLVFAALVLALIARLTTGGGPPLRPASVAPAKAPGRSSNTGTAPKSSGPANCPVGTSPTALTIANSLAGNPVYLDPASSLVNSAQAAKLQAEIGQADPGRIRIAIVTKATVRQGGGLRALANGIASCPADASGVTLVTEPGTTFVVTSFAPFQGTSSAVGAALNTHATMAAGLHDAVKRIAVLDPHTN